ncbi:MAG: DNA replication/repair protein RecF [Coriobacteriia bacterium]|nr:DNA replication/repair protein RecF [Coriobacteriia bacterium]
MSFLIESLELAQFRSYKQAALSFGRDLTILTGPNASGKTNIVEALQLLTQGDSFRTTKWRDLILWESEQAQATLFATDQGRERNVRLCVEDGRRRYQVNDKPVRSSAALAGVLPCVLFTPVDLRLVRDSAAQRRDELDNLGSQIAGGYLRLRQEYKKIVQQRNRLLKDEQWAGPVFEAWTERLVEVGVAFALRRLALFEQLRPALIAAYRGIDAQCALEVNYVADWAGGADPQPDTEALAAAFHRALTDEREVERARHTTTVGPHHDDMVFTLGGQGARSFASQGQQRSIALAVKIAEIDVITALCGTRPLLLLDDVMSELDESRRAALTDYVGTVTQTVITTANIDYFRPELLARATCIDVRDLDSGGASGSSRPAGVELDQSDRSGKVFVGRDDLARPTSSEVD